MMVGFALLRVVVVALRLVRAAETDCAPLGATALSRGGPLRSPAAMVAAIEAEIGASLARDAPRASDGRAALAEVLWSKRDALLVYGGRVVVDRAFLQQTKHAAHAAFVASALERAALPDVAYRFSAGTRGVKRKACRPAGPTCVIAKVNGYGQCGVLVANPSLDRRRRRAVFSAKPADTSL